MESIVVALITGGISLIGTIASNSAIRNKASEELHLSQAVLDTKIDELTREVREHNNFAQRMPVVEEQIKNISRRLSDLEKGGTSNG